MSFLGAETEQLSAHARRVDTAAREVEEIVSRVHALTHAVAWVGPDAQDFRDGQVAQVAALASQLTARLQECSGELDRHAQEQDAASSPDGSTPGGDVAVPLPQPTSTPGPPPQEPPEGGTDRRDDPDGRSGGRVERDEDRGAREGHGHLSHDWAGRAILARYLDGGGDWHLDDDPTWRQYMMDNAENNPSEEGLGNRTRQLNDQAAQDALEAYLQDGVAQKDHAETTNAVLDNGEGVVGSQYLHGSNADVGGFEYDASTTVTPNGDGTYTVQIDPEYTFNDRIDPNGKYTTDRVKSGIAEVLTLGRADPYDIHISWREPVTIVVNADGTQVSQSGWPY